MFSRHVYIVQSKKLIVNYFFIYVTNLFIPNYPTILRLFLLQR